MSLLLLAIFAGGIAFKRGGWQVDFEPKCQFRVFTTNPHYNSYMVAWCHGFDPSTGKHFYHAPKYFHTDMARFQYSVGEAKKLLPDHLK